MSVQIIITGQDASETLNELRGISTGLLGAAAPASTVIELDGKAITAAVVGLDDKAIAATDTKPSEPVESEDDKKAAEAAAKKAKAKKAAEVKAAAQKKLDEEAAKLKAELEAVEYLDLDPEEDEEAIPTVEEVRAVSNILVKANKASEIKGLLDAIGAKSLSTVPEADRAKFIADMKKVAGDDLPF